MLSMVAMNSGRAATRSPRPLLAAWWGGGSPPPPTAATGVVDDGHAVDDEIAHVDRLEIGEVGDRVAVGVPAPEVEQLHLDAAQVYRRLVGERDVRFAGLLDAQEVLPDVAVADDVDPELAPHVGVAADVIAVMVAVEQVPHRLRADRLHAREHVGDVLRVLVVDEDQPFGGHPHGHVARLVNQPIVAAVRRAAARAAGVERPAHHEQAVFHLVDAHRSPGEDFGVVPQWKLLRGGARNQEREEAGGDDDTRGAHRVSVHSTHFRSGRD
jgi:hypothetical protein